MTRYSFMKKFVVVLGAAMLSFGATFAAYADDRDDQANMVDVASMYPSDTKQYWSYQVQEKIKADEELQREFDQWFYSSEDCD